MTASTDTAADVVAALDATDPALNDGASEPATDERGAQAADEATQTDGTEADEAIEGEDALGDAGKKALDRMKERLRAERQARRDAEARLNDQAPADDPDRIRREAEEAALSKANGRILAAEIRAAATGRLSDPTDALTFIDTTQFDVGDDGEVDAQEIADAIEDLLSTKPYLAAQRGPKTPKPDRSQGAEGRGTASTADQFANAIDGLI